MDKSFGVCFHNVKYNFWNDQQIGYKKFFPLPGIALPSPTFFINPCRLYVSFYIHKLSH